MTTTGAGSRYCIVRTTTGTVIWRGRAASMDDAMEHVVHLLPDHLMAWQLYSRHARRRLREAFEARDIRHRDGARRDRALEVQP